MTNEEIEFIQNKDTLRLVVALLKQWQGDANPSVTAALISLTDMVGRMEKTAQSL
jgi:hypothetical protein